jgi:hypothetical protein
MRAALNVLLLTASLLALIHVCDVINGRGTGVRVLALQHGGVLDFEKACQFDPAWCGSNRSEDIGRFVA